MKKAIGYIRVSTEEQSKEGLSLENQREKIKSYSKLKDLELIGIIEDKGISAKNLKRPGIREIYSKIKEIDAIIVYKLDRMFRSTVDALEVTKWLEKEGVSFHSIQETLDTQSAMGIFFFTLIAALAEMERGIISERTSSVLQHKKRLNERVGYIPYGKELSKDGVHLSNNKEEEEILIKIKILREEGKSLREISKELNNLGIRNRGREWNHMSVSSKLIKKV